jgi:hypothetical protein
MKRFPHSIALICTESFFALCGGSLSAATTVSYSFWAYDQYAGNSPYYSHYQVLGVDPALVVAKIDLNDSGNPNAGYVTPGIESVGSIYGPARSIGWHQYEFAFNELTKTATVLMDGNTILSASYANAPSIFGFGFHDYYGGVQESVIDDFQFRLDGILVYQSSFESPTLDSNWTVNYQQTGTYITSGDPSSPHSGSGALALGATTGGNLNASVYFVPEPSALILGGITILGFCARRRR